MTTHPIYVQRTNCRACPDGELLPVLDLGRQFLVRFIDADPAGSPPATPRAPLELMQCRRCGLLQLHHTVDPDLLFREFHYRSGINQTMRDALADVVMDATSEIPAGRWLDIGANDGVLLQAVPGAFMKIAVEPAKNFEHELREIADDVHMDYFERIPAHAIEPCDVITSCAMFYDVDQPDEFVAKIAASLTERGLWINQLNDAPTMIERNAFDAICHEHLCYWDVHALKALYARHGLQIVGISSNEINGGSIRVIAQKSGGPLPPFNVDHCRRVAYGEAGAFAARIHRWRHRMQWLLERMSQEGPLWLYGASTKGSVLLQYLNRSGLFSAIADRNPRKWKTMMAGVGVPIGSEELMREVRPAFVFVLPWAFRREFLERERAMREQGSAFVFPLPNIEVVV